MTKKRDRKAKPQAPPVHAVMDQAEREQLGQKTTQKIAEILGALFNRTNQIVLPPNATDTMTTEDGCVRGAIEVISQISPGLNGMVTVQQTVNMKYGLLQPKAPAQSGIQIVRPTDENNSVDSSKEE